MKRHSVLPYVVAVFIISAQSIACFEWKELKLVRSHVPFIFNQQTELKKKCLEDTNCPYRELVSDSKACWGFEGGCDVTNRFNNVTLDCPSNDSENKYFRQGDFGFLRDRLEEMKSRVFCKPGINQSASLTCTAQSTMCKARNMFLDLRNVHQRIRNRDKVALERGEIGGACSLDADSLSRETSLKRDLSTWGEQVGPYSQLDVDPWDDTDAHCDVIITKPVVFVQLDFGGNMYHHFCDFFNLYLTQLANRSWFGTDVQIIRWDMSPRYGDLFATSWKAFTDHKVQSLHDYTGKRLCISDATFAFLPRMIFGLFYNTPLEENCRGTGLFKAFSEHFLYRMDVTNENKQPTPFVMTQSNPPKHIQVTFLDRGTAEHYKIYRRVLNQNELVAAIRKIPGIEVEVVEFSARKMNFEDQLRVTRNTDIFVGMHGAGLTHFMFLPDWAIAFELYNCDDIRCYRDLPRLRGLRYMTWEDPSKLRTHNQNEHENYGKHTKFWNFSFDVDEFVRLVKQAREWVLEHPRFAHLRNNNGRYEL